MDINEFDKRINEMAAKTKVGMPNLYKDLAIVGLRFVDDNFRNQSWEGVLWKKNERGGTVLVDKGTLRRSFNSKIGQYQTEIYTNVPYAKPHNEGFNETVNIPAHQRAQFKKTKKGKKKKTGTGAVKSHTRKMNLDKRQFAPTDNIQSPTLNKTVLNTVETFFKDIIH